MADKGRRHRTKSIESNKQTALLSNTFFQCLNSFEHMFNIHGGIRISNVCSLWPIDIKHKNGDVVILTKFSSLNTASDEYFVEMTLPFQWLIIGLGNGVAPTRQQAFITWTIYHMSHVLNDGDVHTFGPCFHITAPPKLYRNPSIKIRPSHDGLIFILGILMQGMMVFILKRGLVFLADRSPNHPGTAACIPVTGVSHRQQNIMITHFKIFLGEVFHHRWKTLSVFSGYCLCDYCLVA